MKAITKDDRRRLPLEVRKAVDEYFEKRCLDMDTLVMWILHKRFGFGPVRLKKFFDGYKEEWKSQHEQYQDLTYEKMREALKHNLGVNPEAWEEDT